MIQEMKRLNNTSALEDKFDLIIMALQLPVPVPEYKFLKTRRFKFDRAWVNLRLAAEIEGGIEMGGRHTRRIGYSKDCEKYNLAALNGWRVLRFTRLMLDDGRAFEHLEMAFKRISKAT